jgi:hypothetical protein
MPDLTPRTARAAGALLLAAALAVGVVACSGSGDRAGSSSDSNPAETTTMPALDAPPAPPRIPADFRWSGRYVVPDLGVEVPFTWEGRDGNFQMAAGGAGDPIWFTNLVYDGTLYTLTYTWPGIPRNPCSNVGPFTLDQLNDGLAKAHFVGPEILQGEQDQPVNHFRASVAVELPAGVVPAPPGIPIRIPIVSGDFYVDRSDPTALRQLLHFGFQNLYAADLDEWIIVDHATDEAGVVTLPDECASAPAPSTAPPG